MADIYAALRTADAALTAANGGVALSPAAAAAALNAQTAATTIDTNIIAMLNILLASSTLDYARIVLRARGTPSPTLPFAGNDLAIAAAIQALGMFQSAQAGGAAVVQTSNSTVAAQFNSNFGALVTVGDVSAASSAAIVALRNKTFSVWAATFPNGVVADDVIAARGGA